MQGLVKLFVLLALVAGLVVAEGDVTVLTDANFDELTASGDWLLEFYAPWCGHCKNLAPAYEELATKVKGQFNVAKIDCTVEKGVASRYAIRGYPTIKFLKDGQIYEYAGARDVAAFVDFMEKGYTSAKSGPIPAKTVPPPAAETQGQNKKSDVVELTDSNFADLTSKGNWYLEFFAPWCGHCKRLAPTYEQVATELKGDVNVGKVDCTANKAVCAQYEITGYPTIYYKRENALYSYENARTLEEFKKFAQTGWKTAKSQPVPEPLSGLQAAFHSLLGQIENISFGSINIYLVIGVCVVVGVLLGVCVVAMSPSPAPSKTIHYAPSPSSSSSSSTSSAAHGEITEEVSKDD